jgi:D-glycero-D-manno-heptose 1,7-bisphosphate phosphatase
VWHLLVSHPALQQSATRWESLAEVSRRRPAVFLDRDGVLNEVLVRNGKPYPPTTPAELRIAPDASEALNRLKERGFLLLVVTNQPDVARGKQTRENVEAMNRRLRDTLPLDDVFTCFHDDSDACDCRKPRPGLVTLAAKQYDVDLARSYLAGDRWRDIDAGAGAGCRTVLIDHGYSERTPASAPNARVRSLTEAVEWILQDRG